ncbi:MAG: ATP-grasp domain-containing protein [Proteobacteria bacterium]|nr:ATP-grasp domain-containing protein [Pseudomonadota bacterium]
MKSRAERSLKCGHQDTKKLLVQRHVPGPRHNVYFFAVAGRIINLSEVKILRTDATDGTGLAVSGVTIAITPELENYCHAMVRYLNYSGIGCVQFIVDATHNFMSFLELNPRLGANFAIVYHAGLDLPKMAIDLVNGRYNVESTSREEPCKVGLHYAWTLGELLSLKESLLTGKTGMGKAFIRLVTIAKTALTSRVHVMWSWKDPLPTILLSIRLLPSALHRHILGFIRKRMLSRITSQ